MPTQRTATAIAACRLYVRGCARGHVLLVIYRLRVREPVCSFPPFDGLGGNAREASSFPVPPFAIRHTIPHLASHRPSVILSEYCSKKRSALQSSMQCAAMAHAARCDLMGIAERQAWDSCGVVQLASCALPVPPLSGHGFRPRVWPGSLCPPRYLIIGERDAEKFIPRDGYVFRPVELPEHRSCDTRQERAA